MMMMMMKIIMKMTMIIMIMIMWWWWWWCDYEDGDDDDYDYDYHHAKQNSSQTKLLGFRQRAEKTWGGKWIHSTTIHYHHYDDDDDDYYRRVAGEMASAVESAWMAQCTGVSTFILIFRWWSLSQWWFYVCMNGSFCKKERKRMHKVNMSRSIKVDFWRCKKASQTV